MKISCNKDIKDFLCLDIGQEVFFMENNRIARGEIESVTLSRSVLQSDVLHVEYKVKGDPQKFSGMYQELFPTFEALVDHIKPRWKR